MCERVVPQRIHAYVFPAAIVRLVNMKMLSRETEEKGKQWIGHQPESLLNSSWYSKLQ